MLGVLSLGKLPPVSARAGLATVEAGRNADHAGEGLDELLAEIAGENRHELMLREPVAKPTSSAAAGEAALDGDAAAGSEGQAMRRRDEQ